MVLPNMNGIPWSLAGRLLARDWRSGEVIVLFAALVTSVAAMSAVALFTDRVRQAVSQSASESLAADIRIESVLPLNRDFLSLAESEGVASAEVVHFRSVSVSGESSSLIDLRGVSSAYPLRGQLRVSDELSGAPYIIEGIPPAGEAWAEPSLLARLGLDIGDQIRVGELDLTVSRGLEFRPDEGWRFMEIAPTLLVNLEDVFASNLLRPGSIAEFEMLFAGPERNLDRFRARLEPQLGVDQELRDIRDARPEVRMSIERAEQFLVLSALVSVLLGGVAVAMAARRFVARRLDAVALMKCIGARYADILRLNLVQLGILVASAGVVGSLVGFLAQFGLTYLLADFIEAELPSAGLQGGVLGPITALVVAVGFALPPLLQLGKVPPARVLRQDLDPPPLRHLLVYGVAVFAIGGMLYGLFGDAQLIAYVLVGAVATLAVLYGAGRLLVLGLQQMRGGVGVAWRYGIANVARRGRESSVQVVAFGLGLMVLLLLTIVRTELMVEWQGLLPSQAANRFLINVQPGEPQQIASFLESRGIARPAFTPLVRARISHVNGIPVKEYEARDERARDELNDETNLTWAANLKSDNEVVAGQWWEAGDTRPQISIEEDMLEELGLNLGDELTYSIGGSALTVQITSARRVQWDSFQPNFFMVLNPGEIEQFAHTFVSSFFVEPEQRSVTLDIVRTYPSVSIIDIDAVLDQVRAAMERAALAVQYVFLFTIAAGLMVLLAAIQATRDERMFESAVLRTLGARRSVVLQGVAAEFTALGLLAGTLAAFGASALGYVIAAEVFQLDYSPSITIWIAGLTIGAALVGVSGTLAVKSVVNESPVATLRSA
jgi:putative ABC transport system permease protein